MNISGLRTRVVFQRNTVSIDEVGNHLNSWTDYYACWATVTSSGGEENSDAQGRTVSQERLAATDRKSVRPLLFRDCGSHYDRVSCPNRVKGLRHYVH